MIRPLGKNVLVEIKQSTLDLDNDKLGAHQEGNVVAVGGKVENIKQNDHVLWQQYAESSIFERDGKKFTLVDEKSILGVEEL